MSRTKLGARGAGMGMQITVRDDGTILAYSAKFRPPDAVAKP